MALDEHGHTQVLQFLQSDAAVILLQQDPLHLQFLLPQVQYRHFLSLETKLYF